LLTAFSGLRIEILLLDGGLVCDLAAHGINEPPEQQADGHGDQNRLPQRVLSVCGRIASDWPKLNPQIPPVVFRAYVHWAIGIVDDGYRSAVCHCVQVFLQALGATGFANIAGANELGGVHGLVSFNRVSDPDGGDGSEGEDCWCKHDGH
jgi:hypothetical protein